MSEPTRIEPWDEHNQRLISHVHPSDWVNPTPAGRYNLVILGAGTAGLVTAVVAAGLGARVALVEKHLMGGDCLNVGCVPSKTLIRSARAAADVEGAGRFGVKVPKDVEVDFAEVMRRVRRVRAEIAPHDSAQRYRDLGVDVFIGEGRFTGPDCLEVDGQELRFARAVVATGARAIPLPIEGLTETGYLDNENVFELGERPRRLAVIGAGPIGCELAQSFARLGSEVSLLEVAPQILIREDRDAAAIVESALRRDGVHLLTDVKVGRVERTDGGKRVSFEHAGEASFVEVDEILIGVGRAPNVEGIGLEAAGVGYDARTGIEVDDQLRTSNRRIFAAGDVCLKYKFTHAADAAAKIVVQNALFLGRKRVSDLVVPWCTYTDPEIAHVGLYAHEAAAQGTEIDTYTVPLASNDRSRAEGEEAGFVKVHTSRGSDRILGATIVARHAGELISELTLAMTQKIGLAKLSGVIHPYPTQAEAIKATTGEYMRTRLTPRISRLFSFWLRLRR
jgi:pyruvate/2-oxoglutarate dehydrogenase complex dihydrolipoamide dehydrogenase (E3) component